VRLFPCGCSPRPQHTARIAINTIQHAAASLVLPSACGIANEAVDKKQTNHNLFYSTPNLHMLKSFTNYHLDIVNDKNNTADLNLLCCTLCWLWHSWWLLQFAKNFHAEIRYRPANAIRISSSISSIHDTIQMKLRSTCTIGTTCVCVF
jgi:hypothetical protein